MKKDHIQKYVDELLLFLKEISRKAGCSTGQIPYGHTRKPSNKVLYAIFPLTIYNPFENWQKTLSSAVPCNIKSLFVVSIFIILFSISCTPLSSRVEVIKGDHFAAHSDGSPLTVAILPFENNTDEKDINSLVRESFYSHFSSKNFRDLELSEVDSVLERIRKAPSGSWRELSPSNLGGIFHADFLIYGKVISFKKYFFGIYSQIALEVAVEIVSCKSDKAVWRKTMIKRSHDGGLPFDLFGIIPAALRSGLHMKEERTVQLVDRLSRELVAIIPNPPAPAAVSFFIEIQVASFLVKERAQSALESLAEKGFKPRLKSVPVGDRLWHRIILGPFYQFEEAERVKEKVSQNTTYKPIFTRRYSR